MIAIVNYGLGNVAAIANVYRRLEIPVVVADIPEQLQDADRLILPGVGSFDHAMDLLNQSRMRQTLDDLVTNRNIPVLGICVGMQMMAERSDEGTASGLGWIRGEVLRMQGNGEDGVMLPHMGWNDVIPRPGTDVFAGIEEARFYFLHSFALHCRDAADVVAEADYGQRFTCAVHSGNVFGVQFHPEKSHQSGVRLLENFGRMV